MGVFKAVHTFANCVLCFDVFFVWLNFTEQDPLFISLHTNLHTMIMDVAGTNIWHCIEQETQQNTEAWQGESDWSTATVNGANERRG